MDDYARFGNLVRELLLKRLTADPHGQRFAIMALVALIKDGKIGELVLPPPPSA